jgi:hypothetical protein
MFLVLGRGGEDILWAFQTGYDCSILFGLGALYLGDKKLESRAQQTAVVLLLIGSLASSSVGLFFVCALFAEWAIDRDRHKNLRVLVVPLVVYATWFLLFHAATLPTQAVSGGGVGAGGAPSHGLLHIPTGFFHLYTFIPYGIGASGAALFGLPASWGGLFLIGVAGLAIAFRWVEPGNRARIVGAGAGIVAAFALIGLGRAQAGDMEAASSRYVYVGVAFLLLALPLFLRKNLPAWKRYALAAVVTAAVVSSATQLHDFAATKNLAIAREDVELQTMTTFRAAPDLQMDATIDADVMPQVSPRNYFAAIDALGSPVSAVQVSGLASLSSDDVNRALKGMFQKALTATTAGSACGPMNAKASLNGAGDAAQMDVNSGTNLTVSAPVGTIYDIQLWYLSETSSPIAAEFRIAGGMTQQIHIPDTGQAIKWHSRIILKQGGEVQVCGG